MVANQAGEPTALRLGEGEEPPFEYDDEEDVWPNDPVAAAEFERRIYEEVGGLDNDYPLPAHTSEADFAWQHMYAYFAGMLATYRERGVDDDFLEGAEFHREEARRGAPTDLRLQTEFHYAMQLITMLPEIQQRSLELRTLPLLNHASGHLLDLLQEATRAHLLGLHTASLALCRAALEKALQERVPTALINAERDRSPRRGDLEVLIDSARNSGLLDNGLTSTAHHLRRYANGVLHGNKVVTESASAIGNARLVIDRLFGVPRT